MILQSLNELYDRLSKDPDYEIPQPGFSRQKISFKVVLKPDGGYDIQDARTPNEKGKLFTTVMPVPGDAKPPGAGVNPCLLWDNQTYLLGRQPEDKKTGFGQERFEAFRDRHLALEEEIDSPEFSAVCEFLRKWRYEEIEEYPLLNDVGPGFGVFQMLGEKGFVHEVSKIRDWWLSHLPVSEESQVGQCLITGEVGSLARLHPKIKGVMGAQAAGASLVSFNDTAYESYGHAQSYNSPVGEKAAAQYGDSLNSLLNGPHSHRHRLRIGDTTTVFWTDKPSVVESAFAAYISEGSNIELSETQDDTIRRKVELFLKAVRKGGNYNEILEENIDETSFYLLGLAPNAARLSVRFFHRNKISELLGKLRLHHEHMEMVRQFEEPKGKRLPDPEFPAVWHILRETARVSDEIPPLLGGSLVRSIIDGVPYPEGLFGAVIRRIRADRTINYLRAAILKATLVRNRNLKIPIMLDEKNIEDAYLLGRLFAALEKTQEDALSGINATIRDRFYSSASATPASVFPRLLRTYQHHLSKLNGGMKVNRERLIQDILAPVKTFPPQFNLQKQGLFAIGYYHQRKAFFTKKEDTSE